MDFSMRCSHASRTARARVNIPNDLFPEPLISQAEEIPRPSLPRSPDLKGLIKSRSINQRIPCRLTVLNRKYEKMRWHESLAPKCYESSCINIFFFFFDSYLDQPSEPSYNPPFISMLLSPPPPARHCVTTSSEVFSEVVFHRQIIYDYGPYD